MIALRYRAAVVTSDPGDIGRLAIASGQFPSVRLQAAGRRHHAQPAHRRAVRSTTSPTCPGTRPIHVPAEVSRHVTISSGYVSVYGMRRTTVYLHDAQAAQLKRAAARCGRSEADLIREGVDRILREIPLERPRPRLLVDNIRHPGRNRRTARRPPEVPGCDRGR